MPVSASGECQFTLLCDKSQRVIPLKMTTVTGRETYRLTPSRIFMICPKTGQLPPSKVRLDFITASPTNINVIEDANMPVTVQVKRAEDANTYNISCVPVQEKVSLLKQGLYKGNLTINAEFPDGKTKDIPLPVSVFVKE